jgi:hypothetical protein
MALLTSHWPTSRQTAVERPFSQGQLFAAILRANPTLCSTLLNLLFVVSGAPAALAG